MNAPFTPPQVFLAVEPIDIRQGIDRLSQHVQHALGRPPCDGSAYAFRNRAGNRIKLLVWDGTGVWLCVRRLHRGRFHWPQSTDRVFAMNPDDWHWLTSGIEWTRRNATPNPAWQV